MLKQVQMRAPQVSSRMEPSPSSTRLAVSRNATSAEAIGALTDNYPGLGRAIGSERMRSLATAFVATHQVPGPVLLGYGAEFPAWLTRQQLVDDKPYLIGLAQIDRLATEVRLAPDGSEFSLRDLASISVEEWCECRFKLHPATRMAWFSHRAPTIWTSDAARDLEAIGAAQHAEGILLTRVSGQVQAAVIAACEHRILHGLRLGETVRQTSLAAARLYPNDNITLAFRRIVASGALASPSILQAGR